MNIDIDDLTESELVDLNSRIVERLRMIRQVQAHVRMLDFSIGERVWFQTDLRKVEGILIRYNKKSVTVVTDNGERWTVSPGLLRRTAVPNPSTSKHNVVPMKRRSLSGQ